MKAFGELLGEEFDVFGGSVPLGKPLSTLCVVRSVKSEALLVVLNRKVVEGFGRRPPEFSRFLRGC